MNLAGTAAAMVLVLTAAGPAARGRSGVLDLPAFERGRVLAAAARFLREEPITITASRSPRSAGGPHDFFSEGDYWWPDPKDPDGPYVQRDGMSTSVSGVGVHSLTLGLAS